MVQSANWFNFCWTKPRFSLCYVDTDLVEIVLQEELLQDVGEFRQGGVALLVELDQLGGPQPVVHVEADVHADVGLAVSHLDYGHLRQASNESPIISRSSIATKLPHKLDQLIESNFT